MEVPRHSCEAGSPKRWPSANWIEMMLAFEVVFYFRGLNFNPSPTHFLHSGCVPDLPIRCFQQIIPVVAGLALARNGHPGSSLTRTDIVPKPFPAHESSHYSRLRSQHLRRHEGIDGGTMTKLQSCGTIQSKANYCHRQQASFSPLMHPTIISP